MSKAAAKAAKKELQKYITAYENSRKRKIDAADYESEIPKDVLKDFPIFSKFERNGLDLELTFTAPNHPTWTEEVYKQIFDIAKTNMEALYNAAPGWSWADGKKRAELTDPKARYILARNKADGNLLGFVAFRFLIEDDFEVLYVYEVQITEGGKRKGLGKFMMQLMELVGRKNGMQWVMLTVLKNNKGAFDFYTSLKYEIDSSSPSESGEEAGHEILSKIVDKAGVAAIEERAKSIKSGILPADADAILGRAAAPLVAAGAGASKTA